MENYQVLTYADDVNLIGDDIRTIEINAEVLIKTCLDRTQSKVRIGN